MKVVIRRSAEADLDNIRRWIAQDNRPRAISFLGELRREIAGLSERHALYPVRQDVAGHPLRKLTHGRYLILYRVLPDYVEVLAVRHGARRYPDFG